MPAAKFMLIGLFAVSHAAIGGSGTSANVHRSRAEGQPRDHRLVATQRGSRQMPWSSHFTDEQPVARVAVASEKWLVVLLFAALAAYQLGRNQRSLSHRLSSY
jgi:hypothetical protein